MEGPSRGSYGLNVARLAGIPDRVLALAAKNAAWMRSRRAVTGTSAVGGRRNAPSGDDLSLDVEANQKKRKAEDSMGLSAKRT